MPDSDFIAAAKRAGMPQAWNSAPSISADTPEEAPELMDCADLVGVIAEHVDCDYNTEQFRVQLVKLIDERIALAAESAVHRSGVAYRLHGDAQAGMMDPRKQEMR